ncbi:hypothetical protein OPV22_022801 [Ensete ventricosum]|uniref:Uncharacterized protein n=1 Tax=Ensete ventricosum TaxID=4639 RepID=A0AAV8QGG0_ENSVE|nr:hypothetical protein OPV22_022801 [Ensete ventricosum]
MAGEAAAADTPSEPPAISDFVIHHQWSRSPAAADSSIPRFQPRALHVGYPNGGGGEFERRPRAGEGTVYTSLRDLIDSPSPPSGASSPATPGAGGAREIRIRNRLVKQAAYAYLQPTPSAAESDRLCRRRQSLRRVLAVLTCGLGVDPLLSCIDFVCRLVHRPRR